jgi:hypothetical protein
MPFHLGLAIACYTSLLINPILLTDNIEGQQFSHQETDNSFS